MMTSKEQIKVYGIDHLLTDTLYALEVMDKGSANFQIHLYQYLHSLQCMIVIPKIRTKTEIIFLMAIEVEILQTMLHSL